MVVREKPGFDLGERQSRVEEGVLGNLPIRPRDVLGMVASSRSKVITVDEFRVDAIRIHQHDERATVARVCEQHLPWRKPASKFVDHGSGDR